MVENGKIFTTNVILGRRKAKSDARKALAKPPGKAKKTLNTINEKPETPDIDENVVESILDKIMGDSDSNSSLEDVIKPPKDNQGKETKPPEKPTASSVKIAEPVGESTPETIGKSAEKEVGKELKKSPKKSVSPRFVLFLLIEVRVGLGLFLKLDPFDFHDLK